MERFLFMLILFTSSSSSFKSAELRLNEPAVGVCILYLLADTQQTVRKIITLLLLFFFLHQ